MKKLQLNKIKISKLNNLSAIRGGGYQDTAQHNDSRNYTIDCPSESCDCSANTNTNTIVTEATIGSPRKDVFG